MPAKVPPFKLFFEIMFLESYASLGTREKKAIDKATLRNKTGFEGRKIRDIIYRLKKQGKIKSEPKGIYVKA